MDRSDRGKMKMEGKMKINGKKKKVKGRRGGGESFNLPSL